MQIRVSLSAMSSWIIVCPRYYLKSFCCSLLVVFVVVVSVCLFMYAHPRRRLGLQKYRRQLYCWSGNDSGNGSTTGTHTHTYPRTCGCHDDSGSLQTAATAADWVAVGNNKHDSWQWLLMFDCIFTWVFPFLHIGGRSKHIWRLVLTREHMVHTYFRLKLYLNIFYYLKFHFPPPANSVGNIFIIMLIYRQINISLESQRISCESFRLWSHWNYRKVPKAAAYHLHYSFYKLKVKSTKGKRHTSSIS